MLPLVDAAVVKAAALAPREPESAAPRREPFAGVGARLPLLDEQSQIVSSSGSSGSSDGSPSEQSVRSQFAHLRQQASNSSLSTSRSDSLENLDTLCSPPRRSKEVRTEAEIKS